MECGSGGQQNKSGIDEPSPSLECRSESALIPNGATESGCPLVESDYHCSNEI